MKRADVLANKGTPQKDALCSFTKAFAEHEKKPSLMAAENKGELKHIDIICSPAKFGPVAELISNKKIVDHILMSFLDRKW